MPDDESFLKNQTIERSVLGVGFSKRNFMRAAGVLAAKRGLKFKKEIPSEKWYSNFKQRHQMDLKQQLFASEIPRRYLMTLLSHLHCIPQKRKPATMTLSEQSTDLTDIENEILADHVYYLNESDILNDPTENQASKTAFENEILTLTVPLTTSNEVNVTDLPQCITNDGSISLIANNSPKPAESTLQECTPEMALSVFESTLSTELQLKFTAAYLDGIEINDATYKTWKSYKDLSLKSNLNIIVFYIHLYLIAIKQYCFSASDSPPLDGSESVLCKRGTTATHNITTEGYMGFCKF
ncbi:hypothetical protein KUTeg_022197 [Tegillarca granosa]|uniref:HTH CENPB-type domain-containing protein n=1 Tax=Tegillarca granosa TaxID=220873 RepID=A0ABQ9E5I7_TEGGR|nr:hypothetical protein KUTeg_022197 [Tegillarca granosa]